MPARWRARGRCRCAGAARRRTRAGSGRGARGAAARGRAARRPAPRPSRLRHVVHLERLGEEPAHRHPRVQRGLRVLEHDLQVPAQPAQRLASASGEQVRAAEPTEPAVGSMRRSMQRPVVDLPQPDSPTSASVSPGATSKLTPLTACTTTWRPCSRTGNSFTRSVHRQQRLDLPHDAATTSAHDASRRTASRRGARARARPPARRLERRGSAGGTGSPAAATRRRRRCPGSPPGPRRRASSRGRHSSRPRVYGCAGLGEHLVTVPVSTTRPAYITATRSAPRRPRRGRG